MAQGYPVQLLQKRKPILVGKKNVKCLVQADLWDGDPDIDAICRIGLSPNVKFKKFKPFTSQNLTPFNSQNTFLHRSVLKYYLMFLMLGGWMIFGVLTIFKRRLKIKTL